MDLGEDTGCGGLITSPLSFSFLCIFSHFLHLFAFTSLFAVTSLFVFTCFFLPPFVFRSPFVVAFSPYVFAVSPFICFVLAFSLLFLLSRVAFSLSLLRPLSFTFLWSHLPPPFFCFPPFFVSPSLFLFLLYLFLTSPSLYCVHPPLSSPLYHHTTTLLLSAFCFAARLSTSPRVGKEIRSIIMARDTLTGPAPMDVSAVCKGKGKGKGKK